MSTQFQNGRAANIGDKCHKQGEDGKAVQGKVMSPDGKDMRVIVDLPQGRTSHSLEEFNHISEALPAAAVTETQPAAAEPAQAE